VATHNKTFPDNVSRHEAFEPYFLGQQDGPAADLLHAEFRSELSTLPQVERAYFCKLQYPYGEGAAAVCVVSTFSGDMRVVEALAAVIRRNLDARFHIDILFLSPSLETSLRKVCQPFYVRAQPAVAPEGGI
jgi:hypothetical protein